VDHFSWIAPSYDRIFRRPDADTILVRMAPEPHHRLLDVGGGTGRVAQYLAGRVAQVCVLDASSGMVREGQRKGLCIVQGEAEHIPFGNGAFDRVIAVDAFHHLRDQQLAARELLRVLAPGGRLVIEEPDVARFAVKLVAVAEKLALMRSHFLRLEVLCSRFEAVGGRARVERQGYIGWVIVEET
jgi:ubiquinone/menaquinone biosynthesis C-methylase UbiE